jgi:ribonuclease G
VSTTPSLVYEDLDITLRSVRDLFTSDVDYLIIDDEVTYEKLVHFANTFAPQLKNKISLYRGEIPLFEAYGIDVEISKAIEKKVWLRSGGYIIIESTEALTVIDVNTGRFVGKDDLNDTIFKTNMEAAKEIAYQLRLRNIGGIIIIDFIDMEDEGHREKLYSYFKEAVKKDKSRINILKLSEFGLVQMTRKRNSENLNQMMCEPCHYCSGEGVLKSRRTICYEIFRKISRHSSKSKGHTVTIRVHPKIADMLLKEEENTTMRLESDIGKRLVIAPAKDLHIEKYEIIWQH